jgi:predicted nucleic acid-binding protein
MTRRRRLFDSNYLMNHYRRKCHSPIARWSERDAHAWADDLLELYQTNAIVSPVYLEFVAGTSSHADLKLSRAYLSRFVIVDGWKIVDRDLKEARRIAERVPRDGRPRDFGDCLIRAIANRFSYEVLTNDASFPGR